MSKKSAYECLAQYMKDNGIRGKTSIARTNRAMEFTSGTRATGTLSHRNITFTQRNNPVTLKVIFSFGASVKEPIPYEDVLYCLWEDAVFFENMNRDKYTYFTEMGLTEGMLTEDDEEELWGYICKQNRELFEFLAAGESDLSGDFLDTNWDLGVYPTPTENE